MTGNELLALKQGNLQKALNRDASAYVPLAITTTVPTVSWTGKRAVDLLAQDDPTEYVDALTAVFDEMWADFSLFFGGQQTKNMQDTFVTLENFYGPDGTSFEHVQLGPMRDDEYPQLIANPEKFIHDVLLRRKFPQLWEDKEKAKAAFKVYVEDRLKVFAYFNAAADRRMAEKHGIKPVLSMPERIETPIDLIFDFFRGFRGTLTDLRRHKAELKEACDVLWEYRCLPKMKAPFNAELGWGRQLAHIAPFLSPKMYEELYWPHEKLLLERIAEGNGKCYILMEGKWSRIWDFFADIKQDTCILAIDDDDIFELHAALGDKQIIMGGLDATGIRVNSKEKNEENIRKVIDTCCTNGGFIMATNKLWTSPCDVNQQLVDCYNYAHEYSASRVGG